MGYFGKKLGTDLVRRDQGGFDKTGEIRGEYQVNRFIENCRVNVDELYGYCTYYPLLFSS